MTLVLLAVTLDMLALDFDVEKSLAVDLPVLTTLSIQEVVEEAVVLDFLFTLDPPLRLVAFTAFISENM